MLTSKNFLWLGFFTTLLFMTFCITFNLDKLNPTIVNITPEELDQRELQTQETNQENPPQFTIIKIAKKDKKEINVIDKFNTESFLKKQHMKTENIENNESKTKENLAKTYTKTIEKKKLSFNKILTSRQKQILNRLAYKTNIDKNAALFITTSDNTI